MFRISRHVFAHLRAIAEGIDVQTSATKYLGIEHGHEARLAHKQAASAARAVARRKNEPAWQLIGLTIKMPPHDSLIPTLDQFTEARGLGAWEEVEVLEFYCDAYPIVNLAEKRSRIRKRLLELLKRLEVTLTEAPNANDLLHGWFDDLTVERLNEAGINTLMELGDRICQNEDWYATIQYIGTTKAQRIAAEFHQLLPNFQPTKITQNTSSKIVFTSVSQLACDSEFTPVTTAPENRAKTHSQIAARNDAQAIDAWVEARAAALATKKSYIREASRLLLWLNHERAGQSFAKMTTTDCHDYMEFLRDVPMHWLSNEQAAPGTIGWAPFRTTPSQKSRQQAIIVIASMFKWLRSANYIEHNPWALVNLKFGDDKDENMLSSKAIGQELMHNILGFIEQQKESRSKQRIAFIIKFLSLVGLRSTEFIKATAKDIKTDNGKRVLQVAGKGSKNRLVVIPPPALKSLELYFKNRGVDSIDKAPADMPLVSSISNPMNPIGYQSLYEHVRGWLSKALDCKDLSAHDKEHLSRASTHWLRHTFGTRAVELGVPMDVIQAQMGHASPKTTSAYGRAPLHRRVSELELAFASDELP